MILCKNRPSPVFMSYTDECIKFPFMYICQIILCKSQNELYLMLTWFTFQSFLFNVCMLIVSFTIAFHRCLQSWDLPEYIVAKSVTLCMPSSQH